MYGVLLFLHLAAAVVAQSAPFSHEDRGSYDFQPSDRIGQDNFDPAEDDAKESAVRKPGILDPEVADQLEGNGWLDVIPGVPGRDYPNYDKIPRTSFSCVEKTAGGYYADIEARCQVFHVCSTEGKKISFMCPSGSIFNQKYFVCDWWYDFECDDATDLYSLNDEVNRGGTGSGPGGPGRIREEFDYPSEGSSPNQEPFQASGGGFLRDEEPGFDLSLAGTGEGGPGYARRGSSSRGYQSNVDDKIPSGEKKVDRKPIESAASKGEEIQSERIADRAEGTGGAKKSRGKFLSSASSARGDQDRGGNLAADVRGNGQNFRAQNGPLVSDGISNGGNYQGGNINTNSNVADAVAAAGPADYHFRNVGGGHSKNPRQDRAEKINPVNENSAKNKGGAEGPAGSLSARDNNHRHFYSGTSEEREGEFVTRIPDSAKQSQRRRNTYLNYKGKDGDDGDFQNSGSSKSWGDRKVVEAASGSRVPGQVTEVRSPGTPTDLDYQKKETRISDFEEDDNNFAPSGSGPINSHDSRRHGELRSLQTFAAIRNDGENSSRLNQRPRQSNGKNYRAADYLLGVVPGEENIRNGNEPNEQPRLLPIL